MVPDLEGVGAIQNSAFSRENLDLTVTVAYNRCRVLYVSCYTAMLYAMRVYCASVVAELCPGGAESVAVATTCHY